jgi:hypothetical protein
MLSKAQPEQLYRFTSFRGANEMLRQAQHDSQFA